MKKDKCYDIGVIQAFIDSELASDLQENVIGHIALCDACATLLAETEQESTFAFSVLDEELNVLVPTERLRTKVFASIEESKRKESFWQKLFAGLGFANGFSLNTPGLVAFASVVFFVSALAIGINFYNPMPSGDLVKIQQPIIESIDVEYTPYSTEKKDTLNDAIIKTEVDQPRITRPKTHDFQIMNTGGIKKKSRTTNVIKTGGAKDNAIRPLKVKSPKPPAPSPNLAGEGSYLQTIATLKRTVDMNKDIALRPTERVAYEKDMAMVDNAIKSMKAEVRKNPKNKAAREILRTSYQNKIDLLNSVAEKTELMASIQ